MATKSGSKGMWSGAFVLTFLGSLVYLYVVYTLLSAWPSSPLFAGAGAVFLPIAAAVGVLGSITLFFSSFGLMGGSKDAMMWTMKSYMLSGAALLALTLGVGAWSWYVLLGFVLASLGGMLCWMASM